MEIGDIHAFLEEIKNNAVKVVYVKLNQSDQFPVCLLLLSW